MHIAPQYVRIVQQSFDEIAPHASEVGALFYYYLIDAAPHLRPLLKRELGDQRMKLMHALAMMVYQLSEPENLATDAQHIGYRLATSGLCVNDFNIIGTVMLRTLREMLGERFTPEVQTAWTAVYSALAKQVVSVACATPC